MSTALLATFLVAHGLVHLAVWLPKGGWGTDSPLDPKHPSAPSAVHVAQPTARTMAAALAAMAAVMFCAAAVGVTTSAGWTAPVAVLAALLRLLLKVLYFDAWRSIGMLLDAAVLSAAVSRWPLALA